MKKFLTGVLLFSLILCVFFGNILFFSVYLNDDTQNAFALADETVNLPVIMYHHILEEKTKWGEFVISPAEFESDLYYLSEKGYASVTTKQILDFIKHGTPLPQNPILITFDDGYESTYEYAYPLLQKYGFTAVISPVGKYTDLFSSDVISHINYSHVSWEQLNEMLSTEVFEIGNHSYDMHTIEDDGRKGIKMLPDESEYDYINLLYYDIDSFNKQIQEETGILPTVFSYPYGAYSGITDKILADMGFEIILTCEEKMNVLDANSIDENGVLRLDRFNRASKISSYEFFDYALAK